MICRKVQIPNGPVAIVCGPRPRQRKCVQCGRHALNLCDWKVKTKKSGTCDKPICDKCTHVPAEGKDLCPEHANIWKSRTPK